jgi:hypothetical protein
VPQLSSGFFWLLPELIKHIHLDAPTALSPNTVQVSVYAGKLSFTTPAVFDGYPAPLLQSTGTGQPKVFTTL